MHGVLRGVDSCTSAGPWAVLRHRNPDYACGGVEVATEVWELEVRKLTYVTVCKNTILSNIKHGTKKPTVRVSQGRYGRPTRVASYVAKRPTYVAVKNDMENPLPWGARVWVEIEESA